MFQKIAESLLISILGDYIEGIDNRNLSVSILSGEVDLKNICLKNDVCDKLNLPVVLVHGKMKHLFVKLPWNSLSTSPVRLEIQGLSIVVKPLENKTNEWIKLIQRQNSLQVLEKQLTNYIIAKLQEQLSSLEEKDNKSAQNEENKKEAKKSFIMKLVTLIIDNIQIKINGIHIRYEDTVFQTKPLAMGITLQELDIRTTDSNWIPKFIDRSKSENKDTPLQKLLKLESFGIYIKANDDPENMLSLQNKEDAEDLSEQLFSEDADVCEGYEDNYILKPIHIEAKFKQNKQKNVANESIGNKMALILKQMAIGQGASNQKYDSLFEVNIDISCFEISFRKSQLKVFFKFFELIDDFRDYSHSYLQEQRVQIQKYFENPEIGKQSQLRFTNCLEKMVERQFRLLMADQSGKSHNKKKIESKTQISNKQDEVFYQTIIQYEHMMVLQLWGAQMLEEKIEYFQSVKEEYIVKQIEKKEEQKNAQTENSSSWFSSIGSWFSGSSSSGTNPQELIINNIQANVSGTEQEKALLIAAMNGDFSDPNNFQDLLESQMPQDDSEEEKDCSDKVSVNDLIKELQNNQHNIEQASSTLYPNFNQGQNQFQQSAQQARNTIGGDYQAFLGMQIKFDFIQISLIDDTREFQLKKFDHHLTSQYERTDFSLAFEQVELLAYKLNQGGQNNFELSVSVNELSAIFQQKILTALKRIEKNEHKMLWGQSNDSMLNIKFYQTHEKIIEPDKQLSQDVGLTIKIKPIYFIYRREFIQFFMIFFKEDKDIKENTQIKALHEYEKIVNQIKLQNLVLENKHKLKNKKQGKFILDILLEPSTAFLPIYRTYQYSREISDLEERRQHSDTEMISLLKTPNYFVNISQAPSWVISTGKSTISNKQSTIQDLYAHESIKFFLVFNHQPELRFVDSMNEFWSKDQKNREDLIVVLKRFDLNWILKIKDKSYDYQEKLQINTYEASELALVFKISKLNLSLTPKIFNNLFNIVQIFVPPSEVYGDAVKTRMAEQRTIFKNSILIEKIRKISSTNMKQTFQYIAVFSGSYIYFYEINYQIKDSTGTFTQEQLIIKFQETGNQMFIDRLQYKEYYLLKDCLVSTIEQPQQLKDKNQTGMWLQLINSRKIEYLIEFQETQTRDQWKQKLLERVMIIKEFLNREQFEFGNYAKVRANKVKCEKILELIISEQLDMKNNFDNTIVDDPLQLQQSHEIILEGAEIEVIASPEYNLGTKYADHKNDDVLIFSTNSLPQYKLSDKQLNQTSLCSNSGKFHFLISAKQLYVGVFVREIEIDLKISLGSIQLKDVMIEKNLIQMSNSDLSQAYIVKILPQNTENHIIFTMDLKSQNFKSSRYSGAGKEIEINIEDVLFNFHPVEINRLVRFFRYVNNAVEQIQYLANEIKLSIKQQILNCEVQEINADDKLNQIESIQRRTNCEEDPSETIRVIVKAKNIDILCFHPRNWLYAIFRFKAEQFNFSYRIFCDHNKLTISSDNIFIYHLTKNPHTLNPLQSQSNQQRNFLGSQMIGIRNPGSKIFQLDVTLLKFPKEFTCPLQNDKHSHNSIVKLRCPGIFVNCRIEMIFRLLDYFFNELINSVSDTDPFEKIYKNMEEDVKPLKNLKKEIFKLMNKIEEQSQKLFYLKFQKQVTFLNIELTDLEINLRERPYSANFFKTYISKLSVETSTQEVAGRWLSDYSKLVWTNTITIKIQNINLKFVSFEEDTIRQALQIKSNSLQTSKQKLLNILDPFDLTIDIEKLNHSDDLVNGFLTPFLNFDDFQYQELIQIKIDNLQMKIDQNILNHLFKLSQLNINNYDKLAEYFDFTKTWNISDQKSDQIDSQNINKLSFHQKAQEIIRRYKDRQVTKREIKIIIDNFAIDCNSVSLILFKDAQVFIKSFLDNKQTIDFIANQFYLLDQKQRSANSSKVFDYNQEYNIVIGPLDSKQTINQTEFQDIKTMKKQESLIFENLKDNKSQVFNQKKSILTDFINQNDEKYSLKMNMEMLPDLKRNFKIDVKNLKIYLRPDIFIKLGNMFTESLPKYNLDNYWEVPMDYQKDPGDWPEMVTEINKQNCIVIFKQMEIEQDEDDEENIFSKTLVLQADLKIILTKEKINLIRRSQLKAQDKNNQKTSPDKVIASNKMFINDIQLFLCEVEDLALPLRFNEGKALKETKRKPLLGQLRKNLKISFTYDQVLNLKTNIFKEADSLLKIMDNLVPSKGIPTIKQGQKIWAMQNEGRIDVEGLTDILLTFNDLAIIQGNLQMISNMLQDNKQSINQQKSQESGSSSKVQCQTPSPQKQNEQNLIFDGLIDYMGGSISIRDFQQINSIKSSLQDQQQLNLKLSALKQQLQYDKNKKINNDSIHQIDEECDFDQSDEDDKQNIMKSLIRSQIKERIGKIIENNDGIIEFDNSRSNVAFPLGPKKYKFQDILEYQVNQPIIYENLSELMDYLILFIGQISQNDIMIISADIPKELLDHENGQDKQIITAQGAKLIIINDQKETFLPVISINFSPFQTEIINNFQFSQITTSIPISINLFNIYCGRWEPGIEKFVLSYIQITDLPEIQTKEDQRFNSINLKLETPITVNISGSFLESINQSLIAWNRLQRQIKRIHDKTNEDSSDDEESDFGTDEDMFDDEQEEKLDLPRESATTSLNKMNSNATLLKKMQSVSVVDVRMRKTLSGKQSINKWKDLNNSLNKKEQSEPLAAKISKEKYVTPYVIDNKTDLALVVQRLFKRGEKKSIEVNTFNEKMQSVVIQKTEQILDRQDSKNQSQIQEDEDQWLETGPLTNKSQLIKLYWIKQGTLQDYIVDYNKEAGAKINKQLFEYLKNGKKGLYPAEQEEWDTMIHSDIVGEYVSEYIKIKFDRTSPEMTYNKDQYQENIEIKQVDLNQIGYSKHILREKDKEQIYYGCKLIENGKKVFTIRSQYQLVNFTGFDYLVSFTFKTCQLVKYLESGDSLPLSNRFDDCSIQVKIIDEELIDSFIAAGKTKDINLDRYVFEEESVYKKQQIADFKTKYQNWSALITIKTLKDKLKMNTSSFLTNGKSKFTFIRKTNSHIHGAIDINLMPPIIVHNSLPFIITMSFMDSSNEKQILILEKDEERNLFCFSMASSVFVDISIAGFKTVSQFKLFDLERYESNEYQLQIFDDDGRKTVLYAQVSKNLAGQRINFYCKRTFIDVLDSKLVFLYNKPLLNENNILNQVPSVEQRVLNQKFYIMPELTSLSTPYVVLVDQNQGQPLNLEVTGTQMQLDLVSQRIRYSFSYINEVFLASPFEDVYTTITSFSPQYVLVNQTTTTVYLEQSQIMKQLSRPEQRRQLVSLQVNSGQRKEVNFNCFEDKRFEEFMHFKIEDEVIKFEVEKSKDQPEGKTLNLTKKYQFSCPFEISSIQKFTLRIVPQEELDVATKKDLFFIKDKEQLAKAKAELAKPKFFIINCRGNLGGEASTIGSIFIVVQEEVQSKCEYQIVNLSSFYTVQAKQYIDRQYSNYKELDFSNVQNKDLILYPVPRLGPNLQVINEPCFERYAWSSILDEKLLKISFLFNSNQAIRHDIAHQRIKVKFNKLNESQNERAVKQNNIVEGLLIPLDKLGHQDEFEIEAIGINKKSKLKLEITTNGFTKILTITDVDGLKINQIISQPFKAQRVFRSSTDVSNKISLKQIELRIDSLHLSLMHRKQELLSIFIAKTQVQIDENDDYCKIDFSLGYFQIDNQLEFVKEAPASVLIRPRDLHFDQDGFIRFRLENEDEEERIEREKYGLKTLTDDVSKVIQGSLQINNQASNNNKNILIVENMMFLIQTLSIRVQFRHVLRVLASFYDFSKRLNYSVTKVHYIFQSDDALKIAALESKTIMAEEIQNQQIESGQSNKKELKLSQKKIAIFNEKQQQIDDDHQKQKQSMKQQKRTNKASHMNTTDANWQLSSKVRVQKGSWRIFIKQYQSSPLEVVVSVYNEKLIQKQLSIKSDKIISKDSDDEHDEPEHGGGQDPDEILGGPKDDQQIEEDMQAVMSAKYQTMADRTLNVSSFEDMLFRMNGINVANIFGDGNDVISQIAIYHRESLKLNVLALIGSSNAIGNPSKMVNNIGTGVTDFFVKPYQGMKNGSILNASMGFAKGSKSLLKNAFLAPVGAISKIGNGFSRGALALACDEEFAQEKILDDKKNAPQHVGDGFVKGVSSAGTSIWSGVKGVVTKPIDGAKEDGFGGFFKGIGKGAAGLVGKTVSGVVDIVGKTTEGIDNQLKKTQIKQATKKIRHPRIFYEIIHVLRPYNESHSNWIYQLRQIYNTQISQRSLYELFTIHESIQNTVVNNRSWIEVRGSLFVFSQFHLFRFKITSFINKDEMLSRQTITKLQKKLTVEELIQKEKYLIYNQPKDVCLLVKKETEGIQIDISEVYLARYLDQIDQVNDTLILVWRSDQSQNIIKKPTAQSSLDQQLLEVQGIDAQAIGRIDRNKVFQKKEELIKKYQLLYDQKSKPIFQKVLCDKNTLCIKFDNEFIATKVKTSLLKIKQLIRKQKQ